MRPIPTFTKKIAHENYSVGKNIRKVVFDEELLNKIISFVKKNGVIPDFKCHK